VISKLFHSIFFINNICPNERHQFWQLWGLFDHKSRLGPNNWRLFNAEMRKEHQSKQVFKQNISKERFNILRIFFLKISEKKTKFVGSERTPE